MSFSLFFLFLFLTIFSRPFLSLPLFPKKQKLPHSESSNTPFLSNQKRLTNWGGFFFLSQIDVWWWISTFHEDEIHSRSVSPHPPLKMPSSQPRQRRLPGGGFWGDHSPTKRHVFCHLWSLDDGGVVNFVLFFFFVARVQTQRGRRKGGGGEKVKGYLSTFRKRKKISIR